jgi:hypothetical protein
MQRDEGLEAAEQEQAARAASLSMITAKDTADDVNGVWDGQNGSLIESGLSAEREQELYHQLQLTDDADDIIDGDDAQLQTTGTVRPDQTPTGPLGVPVSARQELTGDDAIVEPHFEPTSTAPAPPLPAAAEEEDDEVAAALEVLRRRGMLGAEAPALEVRDTLVTNSGREVQRMKPADERMVVVRVLADVQPTIGQGPNASWDFKKGRRYRVPQYVANHLDEKGLVAARG